MTDRWINERYSIVRRLGAGAQGRVFLVEDRDRGGRRLALKLVSASSAALRARLTAEFARLSALDHPNLVSVTDLDQVESSSDPEIAAGSLFFTSEYVDGHTPAAAVAAADDPAMALLSLCEDVAAALAHLHLSGIVHCDVKPDNIAVVEADGASRAVLLDLGLSARVFDAPSVRGSLAFMSPEALAGQLDPRRDLFALGACAYAAATGKPPFAGGDRAQLIAAVCGGRFEPLSVAAPWLPASVRELVERLLAPDPAQRPSSAASLQDELAQLRDELDLPRPGSRADMPARRLLRPTPEPIGRGSLVAQMSDLIAQLGHRAPPALVCQLLGPAGSGRRTVVDAAVRRHQLGVAAGRLPPVDVVRASIDELAVDSAGGDEPDDSVRALMRLADRLVARLVARSADRPQLILADADRDPRWRAVANTLCAAHTDQPCLLVVTTDAEVVAGDDSVSIHVPPLSESQTAELVRALVGAQAPADWSAELRRVSGGLPAVMVEVVRAAVRLSDDPFAGATPSQILDGPEPADVSRLIVRQVAGLAREHSGLLEALAVCSGTAEGVELAAALECSEQETFRRLPELTALGYVVCDGPRLSLPSPVHARAIREALPDARRRALHRAVLRYYDGAGIDDPIRLAPHRLIAGPVERAVDEALAAASELTRSGRVADAVEMASQAAELARGAKAAYAAGILAECAADSGQYQIAARAAARAARSRDPDLRRRGLLACARVAQRSGHRDEAERALRKLVEQMPTDPRSVGALARLLVTAGDYRGALEVGRPVAAGTPAERALLDESLALARLYLGERDRARAEFARIEDSAHQRGDLYVAARALGMLGMVHQADGDLASATDCYQRAAVAARQAGDAHGAAVYLINRATADTHRGHFGTAIESLRAALAELRRLGGGGEVAAAQFNLGNALLAVGDLAGAQRAADAAVEAAAVCGNAPMEVYGQLLAGDVARRRRQHERAEQAYRAALALAEARQLRSECVEAKINLAELLAESGDRDALRILADIDDAGGDAGDRLLLCRGRVALAVGDDSLVAGDELLSACERLSDAGTINLAWRAAALAARLFRAGGHGDSARGAADLSRRLFDQLLAANPESRRSGLHRDPEALALEALEDELSASVSSPPGQAQERHGQLRRLLGLSRRLNSELRLAPLLDDVIDTVIELSGAERGFLLLDSGGQGDLEVVVARNIDRDRLDGDELRLSRSIAERAARSGEVVLTVDAGVDDRFDAVESIAAIGLRSVLAAPLRLKSRLVGTIYLDHRFRAGAFDGTAVELVREVANIAAVAIQNAQLAEQNRLRQTEIAELNRKLEAEIERKESELIAARARLPAPVRADTRDAYRAIVGRSPAMLQMFEAMDRVVDNDLPVVIAGDSGSGKELVARAIHESGPRCAGSFVAINCGAVPEQLLESELFGHVRGAFTGAGRDKRGLFEVADGGTLFLDEIADTSLAMQAKLLRVLQEGEIRRVGAERSRSVDVRIIAATNRKLEDLVTQGLFRDDFFYRINVLEVKVPPLRARIEDIPALVEHFAAEHGGVRFSTAALARLSVYPWPGNVRELHNEVARASALADGDAIGVDELSPHIARAAVSFRPRGEDDLAIRPRVEALERSLVEEAMSRTGGNQSQAARLLGLSRFGLQKKLKRYGLAGATDPDPSPRRS